MPVKNASRRKRPVLTSPKVEQYSKPDYSDIGPTVKSVRSRQELEKLMLRTPDRI